MKKITAYYRNVGSLECSDTVAQTAVVSNKIGTRGFVKANFNMRVIGKVYEQKYPLKHNPRIEVEI